MPSAGAGLRIVRAPAPRPARSASRTVAVGSSWQTSTTSPARTAIGPEAGRSTPVRVSAFAPDATEMRFSPRLVDEDQGDPGRGRGRGSARPDTSTPSAASAARASAPKSSSPTAPTNATGRSEPGRGHRLVAALAAVVPLEPAAGHRLARRRAAAPPRTTRSTLTDPTTMTGSGATHSTRPSLSPVTNSPPSTPMTSPLMKSESPSPPGATIALGDVLGRGHPAGRVARRA